MPSSCLDYASNYIYRFPKTEKELKVQLLKKGYSEDEIDQSIDYLKLKGYVNDGNFVELYLNSEVVKKGKPLYLIKGKLLSKGIDKSLLDEKIEQMQGDIDSGILKKIEREVEKLKIKGLDGITIIKKLLTKGYKLESIKKYVEIGQKNKID